MRLPQPITRCLLGLTVAFVVATGLQAGSAAAASTVLLTGRVFNLNTGLGYAGVSISLCDAGSVVTSASGNWAVYLSPGASYCARVVGGVPAGLSGPRTRNNPDVGASATYENQLAGVNAYHNPAYSALIQRWDLAGDGGLDFAYSKPVSTPQPTTAPPAAPVVTPTPTIVSTPSPTPSPSPSPSASPAASPTVVPAAVSTNPPSPARPWLHISDNTLVNVAAIVAVVVLVALAIVMVPFRAARRRQYQEYLRSKYYDL